MKKIYLILCILGTILPYYNLYKFLELNNWSMEGFWGVLYENYAVSMICVVHNSFTVPTGHIIRTTQMNDTIDGSNVIHTTGK